MGGYERKEIDECSVWVLKDYGWTWQEIKWDEFHEKTEGVEQYYPS